MSFAEDLFTRLSTDVGVSAIISTRVYPNLFKEQGATPAIRYNRISCIPIHAMGIDCNIQRQTYQIDLVATTYTAADELRAAVEACLNRWSSTGVVQDSYLESINDMFDQETRLHMIRMDYEFIVEV